MRTVLAAQHFAAVEAVFGRERAANEFLAVGQHAPACRVAVPELLDALLPHAWGMVLQVGIEGSLVAQPVQDGAAYPPCGRLGVVVEDLGGQEPVELQDIRYVVAQPGIEGGLDACLCLEINLVQDGFVVVVGCHRPKPSARASISGQVRICGRKAGLT